MGLLLLLVSIILSVIYAPIGLLYMVIKNLMLIRWKTFLIRVNSYLLTIAVSIDQLGNVIMQDLFNDILIKSDGHKFGNEDETISSVLGKNQVRSTLKFTGKLLNFILGLFEKDHSVKSIEVDENK